jgi:hypothetical protein
MAKKVDRKEFLHGLGRTGMLLALGGVGTAATHGTKTVEECFNHNYCTDCFSFKGCTLPEKKEVTT